MEAGGPSCCSVACTQESSLQGMKALGGFDAQLCFPQHKSVLKQRLDPKVASVLDHRFLFHDVLFTAARAEIWNLSRPVGFSLDFAKVQRSLGHQVGLHPLQCLHRTTGCFILSEKTSHLHCREVMKVLGFTFKIGFVLSPCRSDSRQRRCLCAAQQRHHQRSDCITNLSRRVPWPWPHCGCIQHHIKQ